MAFNDILGQGRVKKILSLALRRRRVPNSLLFCGPEGVGKKNMALVLAKALNCARMSEDACEECPSCRAIQAGQFPDVLTIAPDKDVIKIEQMRELKKLAYLKPMTGRERVFIVPDAEKMSEEAANSLLKVLEEPPLFSHIILISANHVLILPTINSRCQILNFAPVSKADIEKALVGRGLQKTKARILSLLVRGNLEQALTLDWEEMEKKRKAAWKLFFSFLTGKDTSRFLKVFGFSPRSLIRDELENTLELLSSFCRDLILIKEKGDAGFLFNPDFEQDMREAESHLSLPWAFAFLETIEDIMSFLAKKMNVSLAVTGFYSSIMRRDDV